MAVAFAAQGGSGALVDNTSTVDNLLDEVKITMLLTRHAFSCANAVQQFNYQFIGFGHVFVQDPWLTECGAYRSRRLQGLIKNRLTELELPQVSIVLASHLLRAMETAHLMYGLPVTPVPFISEKGFGLDNEKRGLDTQEAQAVDKKLPIDWEGLLPQYQNTAPDWHKFVEFLRDEFLPKQTFEKGKATIAVASHSHFMQHLEFLKAAHGGDAFKVRNNEIFVVRFTYQPSTEPGSGAKLFLDEKQDYEALFPRDAVIPESVDQLCRGGGVDDVGCGGGLWLALTSDSRNSSCCTYYNPNPNTKAPDELVPADDEAQMKWWKRFASDGDDYLKAKEDEDNKKGNKTGTATRSLRRTSWRRLLRNLLQRIRKSTH